MTDLYALTPGEVFQLALRQAERIAALEKQVTSYEDGITWDTTCLGCASLMNRNYSQYVELEQARAALSGVERKEDASEG